MAKKEKPKMEFRYYRDVQREVRSWHFLDRSGSRITGMMWIIFIFIIILRLDTAMVVTDLWCWVKRKSASMEVSLQ